MTAVAKLVEPESSVIDRDFSLVLPEEGESDEELIRRVGEGSREALAALYDRTAKPLYSLAFKMLVSRGDSEEVIQDIYVAVWRQAGKFDARRAKGFTWLTAMLRNRCVDRLRRRRVRILAAEQSGIDPDTHSAPEAVAGENVMGEVELRDQRVVIQTAMGALPEEQRRVVELAFFSGYTHSEIAESENLSLGTVKARIRYGMQKLRARLSRR